MKTKKNTPKNTEHLKPEFKELEEQCPLTAKTKENMGGRALYENKHEHMFTSKQGLIHKDWTRNDEEETEEEGKLDETFLYENQKITHIHRRRHNI